MRKKKTKVKPIDLCCRGGHSTNSIIIAHLYFIIGSSLLNINQTNSVNIVVPCDKSKSPENFSDNSEEVEEIDMQLSQFGDAFESSHGSGLANESTITNEHAILTSNDDLKMESSDTDIRSNAEYDSDSLAELTGACQVDQTDQALRDSNSRKTKSNWYSHKSTSRPFVIMGRRQSKSN